ARVAGDAFDGLGGVDELFGLGVACDKRAELGGLFEGAVDGPTGACGNEATELVGFAWKVHDAARVAKGGLCAERSEGDDLGDTVFSVFFSDPSDDFVSARVLEV